MGVTPKGDCLCGRKDVYLWKGRCSPCTAPQVLAGLKPNGKKLYTTVITVTKPPPHVEVVYVDPPIPPRPPAVVPAHPVGDCPACGKTGVFLFPNQCSQCSTPQPQTHVMTKGRPRGLRAKVVAWTEPEWAHVRWALDYGVKGTRARDLEPHLPGRTRPNIHNALSIERRRRECKCQQGCGKPVAKPGTNCDVCKARGRARMDRYKAEARCTCGNDLNEPGSSGTRCKDCRTKRQKYNAQYLKKFKARRKSYKVPKGEKSKRVITLPACAHTKWAARIAAQTQRPVVSLFGGSGEDLRLVHHFGGMPYGYFDIDENLASLIQCAKLDLRFEVRDRARDMASTMTRTELQAYVPTRRVERAAKIYTLAKGTGRGSTKSDTLLNPDTEFTARMNHLGKALRAYDATVECRNALDVLDTPETFLPANAVLLIDPPWPGAHNPYNHSLTNYEDLLNMLVELPYEMDYILSLGSERQALVEISKTMPHAPLFWRTGGALFSRSIVSLSPRLNREIPEPPGQSINLASLGITTRGASL